MKILVKHTNYLHKFRLLFQNPVHRYIHKSHQYWCIVCLCHSHTDQHLQGQPPGIHQCLFTCIQILTRNSFKLKVHTFASNFVSLKFVSIHTSTFKGTICIATQLITCIVQALVSVYNGCESYIKSNLSPLSALSVYTCALCSSWSGQLKSNRTETLFSTINYSTDVWTVANEARIINCNDWFKTHINYLASVFPFEHLAYQYNFSHRVPE